MKKISRRSFLKASLATSAVAALAGCGATSTSTADASTVDSTATSGDAAATGAEVSERGFVIPAEPVTIKFANHMVLEEGTKAFWEDFKTSFETKYPNVTIEYVTAPYGEIVNTVINMAGGGDIVDVALGEASWTATFAEAGISVPVEGVMGAEYVGDFLPGVLSALTVDGDIYGLPLYMTPFVLYYNADLFTEAGLDPNTPPTTYDEMLEMAPALAALTTADGNSVYPFGQTTGSVSISGSALCGYVYNFGGTVLTPEGELATDNEGFKQAFETLATLHSEGYMPENSKLKDLRNLFAIGQLAMYYDQSWGFSGVASINAEAETFTRSAAPLSGGSGKGDSVVSAHSVFIMNKPEINQQAVALMISELITEETLGEFMANTNLAYPAKNEMAGMAAIAESPVLSGAMEALDSAQSVPLIPTLDDFNLEMCTLAQAVTVGGSDFDSAYETFKNAATAIIAG